MSAGKLARIGAVVVMASGSASLAFPEDARADDYSELLDILKAKGSLTQGEYRGLLAHHMQHVHEAAAASSRAPQYMPTRHTAASTSTHTQMRTALGQQVEPPGQIGIGGGGMDPDYVLAQAQQAAASAQASAASAESTWLAAQHSMGLGGGLSFVRMEKYEAGKGLTFKAGPIDINLSGFINGFYTYNSPAGGMPVAGGVSTGSSGFDSSALRNGLLPAGLILKLKTTQNGIDLAAVMGMYPGIDNAKNGAFNANTGGSPVGLGTAGIDFRQVYVTAGNKKWGTFKIGRDLGIFGGDAILDDATLLSVGSTGSNSAPGNTSLGRIGVGYVYADWIPQISYQSPTIKGFQGTIGILQPLDEFDFSGDDANGNAYSASSTQHSSPMIQGKVTYDFKIGGLSARIWASFLTQHQQDLTVSQTITSSVALQQWNSSTPFYLNSSTTSAVPVVPGEKHGVTAEAGEIGTKLTYGPAQFVGYYYRGSGLGTTGLFFDGVASNGRKRASEGYYVQMMYNFTKKFKLVGSYGVSNLYQAPGENDPDLVRRNESEVGAAYYKMTDWLNLVAEYAHTSSAAHGPYKESDNSASGGMILLF
ncbi:porin [Komagataeibacter oboediens]|uniref:porin n=1 Tax=Komagataeibacter oboediens TaxID=65958 RepID=UPI001C2C8F1E|nr:porin [Komagataeibacter oboediens]MBV0887775.1 porin [Komagataeibacter oboediens]MCK9819993.1 porin [Komagataeibacter oboediens]